MFELNPYGILPVLSSNHTLFGTAQLKGLDPPSAWLNDTLKLHTWSNSRINELPPLNLELIESLKQK